MFSQTGGSLKAGVHFCTLEMEKFAPGKLGSHSGFYRVLLSNSKIGSAKMSQASTCKVSPNVPFRVSRVGGYRCELPIIRIIVLEVFYGGPPIVEQLLYHEVVPRKVQMLSPHALTGIVFAARV